MAMGRACAEAEGCTSDTCSGRGWAKGVGEEDEEDEGTRAAALVAVGFSIPMALANASSVMLEAALARSA